MKRILFVCTGNTCRSPLAEALLRDRADKKGIRLEIRSSGVSTVDGMPMSMHSQAVLKEKDVAGRHSSRMLTSETAAWADLILTMTSSHKRHVVQRHPDAADKTFTLKEYVEDNTGALDAIAELERLIADVQLKQALGEPITEGDRRRITELERRLPNADIADPFGGSLQDYQACAAEIEQALDKLLEKLKRASQ